MKRIWIVQAALLLVWIAGVDAAGADAPAADKPAEPGPWQPQVTVGLNLTQSSFSQNWAGGDKGSVVWVFNGDFSAQRQFNRTVHWSNNLVLAYGQTMQQVPDPSRPGHYNWASPEKSTDQIQFESTLRLTLGGFVDPFGSVKLDTQFQDDTNPVGTIRFNPLRLTESAGIARVLKSGEDSKWITRLGLGSRQTFGRSFVDTTGRRKESFSSVDGGIEWQTTAEQPLFQKRVNYKARLLVYQALFFSKSDALGDFDRREQAVDPAWQKVGDFWKTTDVDLRNSFTAQITKLLAVNFTVQWVYNKFDEATKIDPALPLAEQRRLVELGTRKAGQFRETLALGLAYQLF